MSNTNGNNKREFPAIINEWTDTCLWENKLIVGTDEGGRGEALMLVTRLGTLGQKLIYQAYQCGQESVVKRLQEVREAEPKTGTLHGLPAD